MIYPGELSDDASSAATYAVPITRAQGACVLKAKGNPFEIIHLGLKEVCSRSG